MATIKDIAKMSGYSIGTVSRVINHHSDVSPKAKKKIEEVIAKMNFQPNSNAKLLKQQASSAITILVKGTQNIFLESILEAMQRIFKVSDEPVAVLFLDETANEVDAAVHILKERKPKGLIFLGGNLQYFKESFDLIDVPSVLVTESAKSLGFARLSSYATDDVAASASAMEYLVMRGHTKIGIVGGSATAEKGYVGYRRYHSAITFLKENGIAFDQAQQFSPCCFSIQAGYSTADDLIRRNPNLTAIYAMSDLIAIGAMRAVCDAGLRVPEDISIIGYDGLAYTRFTIPRLATIRQDVEELARKSVEDLLIRISYDSRPAHHEVIPYRVLTGESIKDLKHQK